MSFVSGCLLSLLISSPVAAQQKRPQAKKPAAKHAVAKKPAAPALDEQALQTQVMLDRAGLFAGRDRRTDGHEHDARARRVHRRTAARRPTTAPLVTYKITDEDAAGPFTPDIPEDMMEKAKLPALGYKNLAEALGERFHVSPALLKTLNPQAKFAAGEEIRVPNVASAPVAAAPSPAPAAAPAAPAPAQAVIVTVRKSTSDLTVTDAAGKVLIYAPVTTGSEHDPLPIGEWKVNGVQSNPTFRYNPELFWDADAEPGEGEDSRRAQQSGRRRLDRHLAAALRPARHARAVDDRQDRRRTAACG